MLKSNNINNFAFIDGANLHKGVLEYEWDLDYSRFLKMLEERYSVKKTYLFIGFIKKYEKLYFELERMGYILVFKETIGDGKGSIKGNCDSELVLTAVSNFYENKFDKAVLVSGDGDFRCLVDFFLERGKMERVIAPNPKKCSIFLKRTGVKMTFLNDLKNIISKKEKAPDAHETH